MNKKCWLLGLAYAIASCGGIGYTPVMPGTVASAFAALSAYMFFAKISLPILLACIIFLFFLGVYSSTLLEKECNLHDPSFIVIDELVGMWLALSLVPQHFCWYLLTFILFRFFDITKLGGCKIMQRQPHGWGIMLDDVLAGVWSLVLVQGFIVLIRLIFLLKITN